MVTDWHTYWWLSIHATAWVASVALARAAVRCQTARIAQSCRSCSVGSSPQCANGHSPASSAAVTATKAQASLIGRDGNYGLIKPLAIAKLGL